MVGAEFDRLILRRHGHGTFHDDRRGGGRFGAFFVNVEEGLVQHLADHEVAGAGAFDQAREIGIRRSVGATAAHVMQQFITEAVVLSLGGGLLGIVLGLCLAWGISAFAGWHTVVTPWSVLLSFAVSAGTGLIFGIYPARRAAALDPIEALRHE